ncbi:hypothetical protein [Photorhabdus namnaonensis]|uniref:hypothetical protein n=1 Tax=Photorhabdus namnaonensis TaxID=1851568 RepID=UPI0013F4CE6D|nr:hypothetical protein [Photorhabdus namnaonensis]
MRENASDWGNASGGGDTEKFTLDASRVVPTANENRPRNIAFNYIVKRNNNDTRIYLRY